MVNAEEAKKKGHQGGSGGDGDVGGGGRKRELCSNRHPYLLFERSGCYTSQRESDVATFKTAYKTGQNTTARALATPTATTPGRHALRFCRSLTDSAMVRAPAARVAAVPSPFDAESDRWRSVLLSVGSSVFHIPPQNWCSDPPTSARWVHKYTASPPGKTDGRDASAWKVDGFTQISRDRTMHVCYIRLGYLTDFRRLRVQSPS